MTLVPAPAPPSVLLPHPSTELFLLLLLEALDVALDCSWSMSTGTAGSPMLAVDWSSPHSRSDVTRAAATTWGDARTYVAVVAARDEPMLLLWVLSAQAGEWGLGLTSLLVLLSKAVRAWDPKSVSAVYLSCISFLGPPRACRAHMNNGQCRVADVCNMLI